MKFEWETDEERILKFMKIPPEKKLEWLKEMHELIVRSSSRDDIMLRWKLRGLYFDEGTDSSHMFS